MWSCLWKGRKSNGLKYPPGGRDRSHALAAVVGWVVVRIGLFEARESEVISRIAVYICSPCIVVTAFQMEITAEKVTGLFLAFVAAVLVHIFLILVMRRQRNRWAFRRSSGPP